MKINTRKVNLEDKKLCVNCHHAKRDHSYSKPHDCLKVIETTCYQDGHWVAGI